jgi:hypothetical protein
VKGGSPTQWSAAGKKVVKMFDSILLALSLAVTGEANAGNRQKADSANAAAAQTAQVMADSFDSKSGFSSHADTNSQNISEDIGPEHLFQREAESSTSGRSQDRRSIELREEDVLSASDLPGTGLASPREGWNYEVNPFFHDSQLQSGLDQNSIDAGTPTLTFWHDSPQLDDNADYGDIRVEFAAANPTPTNVLIPLPPAAWSAISVISAAGLARGIRNFRRRLN